MVNNLQNEMNDDVFSKVDNMWMLNEDETWNHLQTSIKSLSEFVSELEENVTKGYDEMFLKINGIGRHGNVFLINAKF